MEDVTLLGSGGVQNEGRMHICVAPSAASATWTCVLDAMVARTTAELQVSELYLCGHQEKMVVSEFMVVPTTHTLCLPPAPGGRV